MRPELPEGGAQGRLLYLAENLASLHAALDVAWLAGRFEFLGEKALGASLTVLALPDETGSYRAADSATTRPATARALWEELGIDTLASNAAAAAIFRESQLKARPIVATLSALFPGRFPGLAFDDAIVAPIAFNRELLGVGLFAVQPEPLVESMAAVLVAHAAVAMDQLHQREEARRLHSVDPRLWVPDEHFLLSELRRELSRARRYRRDMGFALLRLDNEREIRHQFGDFFTDHLLRRIGGQLLATVRDSDVLGALHGGFGIIHTDTSLDGTIISAERLRAVVTAMVQQRFPEIAELRVSARVAAFPAHGDTVEALLDEIHENGHPEQAAA
jgi:diguanylate cyclase (GGDEF)-like protein